MKKQLPLGLVVEGNVTSSALLRLSSVAEELGPIKSTGLQLSRRISNFLRAGYAVSAYHELQKAKLILLKMPDSAVANTVQELCASEIALGDLSFVLCESWLPTEILAPLRERGAAVASLVSATASRNVRFAVEGDTFAVRQIRRVIERGDVGTIELRPGTKALYFASKLMAVALPVPLLLVAQKALRESGVSGNNLSSLLEDMTWEMFDSFSKGARVPWGGPLTECSAETARAHWEQLKHGYPELAATVEEQLTWAREFLGNRARGVWPDFQ
jgi:predicted short-subunit dehydrogenase-like oxidoreductase (DUF2520 family)